MTLSPDDEILERLKDVADELGAMRLSATLPREGRDCWRTLTVRHAGGLEDTRDGWATEITEDGL